MTAEQRERWDGGARRRVTGAGEITGIHGGWASRLRRSLKGLPNIPKEWVLQPPVLFNTHTKKFLCFLGHQSHKTSTCISQTIFQVSFASSMIDSPQGKNALRFSKRETYTFSTNSSWNEHVHLYVYKSFKFQSTVVLILVHNFGLLSANMKLCCPEWCKLGTPITNLICIVSPFL